MTSKSKVLPIIIGAMAIIWCVWLGLYADFDRVQTAFWVAAGFGLASFVLAAMGLVIFDRKANPNTTEISMIHVFVAIIYLVIAVVFNTIRVLPMEGEEITLIVVANLIMIFLFFVISYGVSRNEKSVKEMTDNSAEMIRPVTMISNDLARVLSIATDAEVKKQLTGLKELVDYSSNSSQNVTGDYEYMFTNQIGQIRELIVTGAGVDEIKNKIAEAENTWKMRNSSLR